MDSQFAGRQPIELEQAPLSAQPSFTETNTLVKQTPSSASEFTHFHGYFQDSMEMYAEQQIVTNYLDAHQDWFSRCAHPMRVEAIGLNGYALVVGRFAALGYELEPKIGLELLPQENGIYRIQTIPVPNYIPQGYEVDFRASQGFVEVPAKEYFQEEEFDDFEPPALITRVEWELNLSVALQFPRFIQKLPQSLVQNTGDRLLSQIVRQISRRLTYKVQEDFHRSLGLPMPKKFKKR